MLRGRDKRQRRTDRLFASMETTNGPMRRGYSPFWTGAPAFATHAADQSCDNLFIHPPVTFTYVRVYTSGYALFPISGAGILSVSYFNGRAQAVGRVKRVCQALSVRFG